MFSAKVLSTLGILAFTSFLLAQAPPPTAYTITSALAGPDPGTMTVYRNGSRFAHPVRPQGHDLLLLGPGRHIRRVQCWHLLG